MKAVLEKTLDDVKQAEDEERDSYALMRLSQRRQVVEQKLTAVRQQLADSAKVLCSCVFSPLTFWWCFRHFWNVIFKWPVLVHCSLYINCFRGHFRVNVAWFLAHHNLFIFIFFELSFYWRNIGAHARRFCNPFSRKKERCCIIVLNITFLHCEISYLLFVL